MKIYTVIGARPQFIKAGPVSVALKSAGIEEDLIHTGQHYDYLMSEVFFKELGIAPPRFALNLGGGTHGSMTASMLEKIEQILLKDRPTHLMVYGDTNSTLAGALAATKLHIPIIHIEAGLRSFNRRMPEEINRVLTDHVSEILICPSDLAKQNLELEGIKKGVHVLGDVMAASSAAARDFCLNQDSGSLDQLGVKQGEYYLATIHRAENTDVPQRLASIFEALSQAPKVVLLPLHPRTKRVLQDSGRKIGNNIKIVDPLSYFDMTSALVRSAGVITDSGGLQKEAYWAQKPCITLRDETEWTETVAAGWNVLTGADAELVRQAFAKPMPDFHDPGIYGDTEAPTRIAQLLSSLR